MPIAAVTRDRATEVDAFNKKIISISSGEARSYLQVVTTRNMTIPLILKG